MLQTILDWIGAGDSVLLKMGPVAVIAVSMFAGFALTQAVKFPLARHVPDAWREWSIRTFGIVATWAFARVLGELPLGLELVAALGQPFAYFVVVGAIHRWFPWVEAGRVLGSAAPSETAVQLRAERKGGQ